MTDETARVRDPDPYLLAQVREAFGRVVYSQKTHEKQADICFSKHRWQQGVLIALTAISSGTFLALASMFRAWSTWLLGRAETVVQV